MKKSIVIFVFLLLCLSVFAQPSDEFITASYNWGSVKEKGDSNTTGSYHGKGFDLAISDFWGDCPIGFYVNTEYLFIDKIEFNLDGAVIGLDKHYLGSPSMMIDIIMGVAFNYEIDNNLLLSGGVGLNISELALALKLPTYTGSVGYLNIATGIGGDIGVKYMLNEKFYFTGGTLFQLDFNNLYSVFNGEKVINNASYSCFKPYIGIGLKRGSSVR